MVVTTSPAVQWSKVELPSAGTRFDYQIGGAYPPPDGVRVVSRDRSASPVAGLYNICYINAFQAQPGADTVTWWQANHPGLLLRDTDGALVMDLDWNEALLDVSTDAKRAELAAIEDAWVDDCRTKGYQAVEPDNLDSYQRSHGLLTAAASVAFASRLAKHAHEVGLAIAQKNTVELLDRRDAIGFDFAVTEQCGATDECGQYAAAYNNRVLDVEYDQAGFAAARSSWGSRLSIVRRDRDVSTPGNPTYVYESA
ncbi:endo alpha-1,4 polygalactosaminidase [Nocardia sp. NPDC049707]|uniref:endo alpha-1,4 polygalactosaminidase n=1 Tax=Nocardia sp. NPDC049707 TaxID=3154735 RepID=UPI00343910C5